MPSPLTRWSSDNNLKEAPKAAAPRKISLNIASVLMRSTSHEPKDLLKAKLKQVTSPPVIYLPDNVYHTIHHEPSRYRRRIPVTPFSDFSPPDFALPRTRSWTDVSGESRRLGRRDPFYTHYENKYLEALEDDTPYYRPYPMGNRHWAALEYRTCPYVDPLSSPVLQSPPTPLEEYRPLERTYRVRHCVWQSI